MNDNDTLKLLKETDKGVQMAIYSFDQLLDKVDNPALKKLLTESRNDHKRLKNETANLLKAMGSYEEEPPAMAKGMAWMETNWKMGMEYSDRVVARYHNKGLRYGCQKPSEIYKRICRLRPGCSGYGKKAHCS